MNTLTIMFIMALIVAIFNMFNAYSEFGMLAGAGWFVAALLFISTILERLGY